MPFDGSHASNVTSVFHLANYVKALIVSRIQSRVAVC